MKGYTWQLRFGGDPAVVGRMVRLNGQTLTVIGVAPESFSGLAYPVVAEMWIPVGLAPTLNVLYAMRNYGDDPTIPLLDDRRHRWLWAIGRLAPGMTPAQAAAELKTIGARLAATYPSTNEDLSFRVVPATQVRIDPEADKGLKYFFSPMVMGFVAMVLLIAAANLANMLLARAAGRRKEIATRLALGAGRGRLLRQLLLESLVLALLGGSAGLLLAIVSNDALSSLEFLSSLFPGRYDLGLALDAKVVTFTLLVATLTAVAFGLEPARECLRTDLTAALHGSSSGVGGASPRPMARLVVVQVALSVLLLLCCGLSLRSLWTAYRVDPGFDSEGVVVARFMPETQGYGKEQADELYRRMEERLLGFSGIESVAFALSPPLSLETNLSAVHPVSRGEPPKKLPFVDISLITPGYFETLRIPFLEGRDFTQHDTASSSDVVIVSQAFARRFWPGESALGQRLFINDFRRPRTAEVVGVVADNKHRTLGESGRPFIYWPYAQDTFTWRTIFVRSDSPPAALAAIRQATRELDKDLAIFGLETLEELTERQVGLLPRAGAKLFGLLGLIGLILATIGIYAVMAYSVSQRQHEIGVRVAMGAEPSQVVRLVLRRGVVLTTCGVFLGVAIALVVTWVLSAILYGISPIDPVTFLAVPLALAAVALTAIWIPARRAASVDPLETLRCE